MGTRRNNSGIRTLVAAAGGRGALLHRPIFTLLALNTGDVSVATPVLGLKILLVALLTSVLLGDPIGTRLWTAAALSSAAIALLNLSPGHSHTRVRTTILLAALGATSYACFDVVVQKWSLAWERAAFCPSQWRARPCIQSR